MTNEPVQPSVSAPPPPTARTTEPQSLAGVIVVSLVALILMFGVPVLLASMNEGGRRPRTNPENLAFLFWGAKIVAGLIALGLVFKSQSIFGRICGWIILIVWIVGLALALLTL
jgi:hypothetical protein